MRTILFRMLSAALVWTGLRYRTARIAIDGASYYFANAHKEVAPDDILLRFDNVSLGGVRYLEHMPP